MKFGLQHPNFSFDYDGQSSNKANTSQIADWKDNDATTKLFANPRMSEIVILLAEDEVKKWLDDIKKKQIRAVSNSGQNNYGKKINNKYNVGLC